MCERGTASLNLLIGKGVRHHFVSVLGEDGVANADLWRQTLQVIRPTPFRFAGPLWTAYANSKANLCSALNGILHHYGAALGSSSSKAYIDPFVASIGAFYKARLEGSSLRDDVNNGNAVVEYCERVARSAKFAPARQEAVANAI